MADLMYRLVLRAQFENQAELNKAIEGLNQLEMRGNKVTVNMGDMGRASSSSLNGLASSALRVGFMFNMMESALMRQEMASMMAENAQNRLNDAVARYGVNSEQARRAAKQYESEMAYLNNANLRANVSMGLMATQLILQSGLLDAATLAQIRHAAAVAATTLAHWAEVAALKAKAIMEAILSGGTAIPMMLIGAAAGVAIVGIASVPTVGASANINVKTDVNVETDVDDALKKQNQQVKDELKRMRP
jgi:hypothetical protein